MDKLKDILLLPRSVYGRLTGKKLTLIIGIIFVGCVDLLYRLLSDTPKEVFFDQSGLKPLPVLLAVLAILLLGFMDVVFFSLPMADLFKFYKKEKEPALGADAKFAVMKIYIIAHLVLLPVDILYLFIFKSLNLDNLGTLEMYLVAILLVLPPIWFSALISRGINEIYDFQPLFKRLVFPAIFLWSFIISEALHFALDNWVMKLFGA